MILWQRSEKNDARTERVEDAVLQQILLEIDSKVRHCREQIRPVADALGGRPSGFVLLP